MTKLTVAQRMVQQLPLCCDAVPARPQYAVPERAQRSCRQCRSWRLTLLRQMSSAARQSLYIGHIRPRHKRRLTRWHSPPNRYPGCLSHGRETAGYSRPHAKQMIGSTIRKTVQQVIGAQYGVRMNRYPSNVDLTSSVLIKRDELSRIGDKKSMEKCFTKKAALCCFFSR